MICPRGLRELRGHDPAVFAMGVARNQKKGDAAYYGVGRFFGGVGREWGLFFGDGAYSEGDGAQCI